MGAQGDLQGEGANSAIRLIEYPSAFGGEQDLGQIGVRGVFTKITERPSVVYRSAVSAAVGGDEKSQHLLPAGSQCAPSVGGVSEGFAPREDFGPPPEGKKEFRDGSAAGPDSIDDFFRGALGFV